MAQRAADETVTEANARAEGIMRDAEQHAQALVGEAETNARRLVETERRRRAEELDQLTRRCDELRADAAALDEYVSRYRSRVRDALETELSAIGLTFAVEPPSSRPDLHDVHP
jgi:cell division septum initiation protein DivIVA